MKIRDSYVIGSEFFSRSECDLVFFSEIAVVKSSIFIILRSIRGFISRKHVCTWVALSEVAYTFWKMNDQGYSWFCVLIQHSEFSSVYLLQWSHCSIWLVKFLLCISCFSFGDWLIKCVRDWWLLYSDDWA